MPSAWFRQSCSWQKSRWLGGASPALSTAFLAAGLCEDQLVLILAPQIAPGLLALQGPCRGCHPWKDPSIPDNPPTSGVPCPSQLRSISLTTWEVG